MTSTTSIIGTGPITGVLSIATATGNADSEMPTVAQELMFAMVAILWYPDNINR